MAWLDIDIINRALRLIKEKSITNINDNTPTARCVKDLYPQIKSLILSLHPWNCATRRASLSIISEKPAYQFAYYHALPNDCLKIVEIDQQTSWQREGHKIASDSEKVDITYIANINSQEIDDNVARIIAARLAFEAALSISQSSSLAERMYKLYEQELISAKHIDACEAGQGKFEFQSTWI